jgi:hypothetical protein
MFFPIAFCLSVRSSCSHLLWQMTLISSFPTFAHIAWKGYSRTLSMVSARLISSQLLWFIAFRLLQAGSCGTASQYGNRRIATVWRRCGVARTSVDVWDGRILGLFSCVYVRLICSICAFFFPFLLLPFAFFSGRMQDLGLSLLIDIIHISQQPACALVAHRFIRLWMVPCSRAGCAQRPFGSLGVAA